MQEKAVASDKYSGIELPTLLHHQHPYLVVGAGHNTLEMDIHRRIHRRIHHRSPVCTQDLDHSKPAGVVHRTADHIAVATSGGLACSCQATSRTSLYSDHRSSRSQDGVATRSNRTRSLQACDQRSDFAIGRGTLHDCSPRLAAAQRIVRRSLSLRTDCWTLTVSSRPRWADHWAL